jgi:hypothetical protein
MKLDNPQKFVSNGIDGTLIARGEIKCQFSSYDLPAETMEDWSDEYNEDINYKWIRISFDNGNSWPIKYKLNIVEEQLTIFEEFDINTNAFVSTGTEDGEEYTHKYVIPINTKQMFDQNYGKVLNIAVSYEDNENKETKYINYFAPIQWKQKTTVDSSYDYSVEIFFNENFISTYAGWKCTIKSS